MTVDEVLVAWTSETEPWAGDRRRRPVANWIAQRLAGLDGGAVSLWWECVVESALDWARTGVQGLCPYLDAAVLADLLRQVIGDEEHGSEVGRAAAYEQLKSVIRRRAQQWRAGIIGDVGEYIAELQAAQEACGLPVFDGHVWIDDRKRGYMRGGPVHPSLLQGAEHLLPPSWHSAVARLRLAEQGTEAEETEHETVGV